jgi:hypothetical protein
MQIWQEWKNIFINRFTSYLCAIFGIGARHKLTHNISKIGIQRSYGLKVMLDLGFSYLYFSCKNYQKLAQAKITKVV